VRAQSKVQILGFEPSALAQVREPAALAQAALPPEPSVQLPGFQV